MWENLRVDQFWTRYKQARAYERQWRSILYYSFERTCFVTLNGSNFTDQIYLTVKLQLLNYKWKKCKLL
jgi:hypothetical protein